MRGWASHRPQAQMSDPPPSDLVADTNENLQNRLTRQGFGLATDRTTLTLPIRTLQTSNVYARCSVYRTCVNDFFAGAAFMAVRSVVRPNPLFFRRQLTLLPVPANDHRLLVGSDGYKPNLIPRSVWTPRHQRFCRFYLRLQA